MCIDRKPHQRNDDTRVRGMSTNVAVGESKWHESFVQKKEAVEWMVIHMGRRERIAIWSVDWHRHV